MSTFIDTSAFYAYLDQDDKNHDRAVHIFLELLDTENLVTTNYVLVETTALLQNRLGLEAVRLFFKEVIPAVQTVWIEEAQHWSAVLALSSIGRRNLSLIDLTSFDTINRLGLDSAFTFDKHFKEQGIQVLPE